MHWFHFSASCKFPALALNLTGRNAHSKCGGPKTGSETPCCTVVTSEQTIGEQAMYAVDTKKTELQNTRMAIAPNVDREHRHHTGHINDKIIYKLQHQPHSQLPSTCPTIQAEHSQSIAGRQLHKNGSNLAGSCPNWMIRVALASLRSLLS